MTIESESAGRKGWWLEVGYVGSMWSVGIKMPDSKGSGDLACLAVLCIPHMTSRGREHHPGLRWRWCPENSCSDLSHILPFGWFWFVSFYCNKTVIIKYSAFLSSGSCSSESSNVKVITRTLKFTAYWSELRVGLGLPDLWLVWGSSSGDCSDYVLCLTHNNVPN